MHSLKDTQFWLCYFLFIVPVVKNDLKLNNHITQLIFIAGIFRPKIKCTTLFGGTLYSAWSVVFCQKFDRSRNGYQVIRLGAWNDFVGLPCRCSLSPRVSPSRAPVFSCAHYFQAPATWAIDLLGTLTVCQSPFCLLRGFVKIVDFVLSVHSAKCFGV